MREETVSHDITVVGGGLAGVCAAVAAARLGRTVALVGNRPVLGGNSSSEVRVWVCGATGHGKNHHAREGGIMGELLVENQYRNPLGNPYLWDTTVLDAVRAEPGISLYLNTDVRLVDAGESGISSVTGWMMGSERLITFESPLFLDCTGDGLVGHLAGARYRIGREGRAEYGEPWAPDEPDDITLGSTLLFYTKDAGSRSATSRRASPRTSPPPPSPSGASSRPVTTAAPTGGSSSAASWTPCTTTTASGTSCGRSCTASGTTSRTPASSTPTR
ncbi:FAD-dependent oxidoreductase [Nonomuraea rubra]|uniref:FAD-dependent oxidoreductase n=1 Tax=Nonomuraea rubra TaxID=46180 RepID=UPI00361F3805